MKNIRVLLICPNKVDGTSFYRAWGVFGHLSRNYPIEVIGLDYADNIASKWNIIESCDIAFIQRPHTVNVLHTLRYIKQMQKPVILDFDDDLFNITPSNPAYMAFKDQRTKDAVTNCIEESDHVIVSTEKLKEVYGVHNKNITVIRNAFNSELFKYAKERRSVSNLVLWRGGSGHLSDLNKFKTEILSLVNNRLDYNWAFIGFYPPFIPEERANIRALDFSDVITYNRLIYNLKPKVVYVPLEKTIFNDCKSNVAFIEGTMAGAVCIVPDWQEWRCPGTLLYKDEDEFRDLMKLALRNDFDVNAMNKKAWNYINNEQSLDVWNKKRFKLIKELV